MLGKSPIYDLEEIQNLIGIGNLNVNYIGSSERDATNIDYSDEDIKKCLLSLSQNHFTETKEYLHGHNTALCDVYLIDYIRSEDCIDSLYIKFKYSASWLTLFSFHLQR